MCPHRRNPRPSTANRDRNEKLALYQERGVEYYLIVDSVDKTADAYRRSVQGLFEQFDPAGVWEFTVCDDCRIRWDGNSVL